MLTDTSLLNLPLFETDILEQSTTVEVTVPFVKEISLPTVIKLITLKSKIEAWLLTLKSVVVILPELVIVETSIFVTSIWEALISLTDKSLIVTKDTLSRIFTVVAETLIFSLPLVPPCIVKGLVFVDLRILVWTCVWVIVTSPTFNRFVTLKSKIEAWLLTLKS